MKKYILLYFISTFYALGYSQTFDSTDYQIIHLQDTIISGTTVLHFKMTTNNNSLSTGYADFTFIDQNGDTITSPTNWSMWMPQANNPAFDTTSYLLNFKAGINSFPLNFNGFLKIKNPECTIPFNYSTLTTTVDNVKELSFVIYPNPSSEKLSVINNLTDKLDLIQIYNQAGELVKSLIPLNNYLNISDLPKGVYFLKIYSNSITETVKILKN